ncbi:unnamed protein product [Parascedosporium putredinis]|uniref:Heterokaryon incompatibility domain-containing protein n=1 Tax=Parascedosporium putredinis TaxID=1442378 RepID=A0A9P1M857_9PEZI|nr:unnamed protein product [Parascedosporium putredinis]CAI7991934.1 unnamed protein product [Parascedosporium putredinis]
MATITAPLPYSYQALPARRWFRVLNLHPGSLDSPISCELVSTPLISAPTYKALSYRTIQVTRSLHEALRHLRHANEPITIWADAICINQSDMSEKGHQVDMMGDIYERAGEVLVWFGNEHADRAALAFRSLEAINTKITTGTDRESFNPDRPNPALEYVEPRLASAAVLVTATRSTLPSIITEDCKAAITRLYTMPWFTRVWVLQEVGLAARATAFWGDESIEFSHIAEFIQHARIHSDLRGNLGQEILGLLAGPPDHALWNVWSTYDRQGSWLLRTPALREFSEALASQTKIDFVLVLEASRLFGATNDLDHVYAFLGHPKAKLAGRNEPLVQANYSIGVDELHLLVASRLALESFNFLAQVQVTADSLLPGVTASLIDSVAEQTEIMSPKDFEEGQPGPGISSQPAGTWQRKETSRHAMVPEATRRLPPHWRATTETAAPQPRQKRNFSSSSLSGSAPSPIKLPQRVVAERGWAARESRCSFLRIGFDAPPRDNENGDIDVDNDEHNGCFHKIRVFERRETPGGTCTNVPDIAMSFSDSRFAYGPFAPHWVPRQYIENYFSIHKTDSYLVLNTTVERHADVWWEEEYDAVVLANGHYSIPYIPDVVGLEAYMKTFPGRVVHSKTYREPHIYADKRVLIIGNSASGHDLSTDLIPVANSPVYHGRIVFVDGSYLDDIDTVIYCTGYKPSFPFWDTRENGRPIYDYGLGKLVDGYLHTFFQDLPTLGIVGFPRVLTFRSFEYQAIALARLFAGRNATPLPSVDEQARWEKERLARTRQARRKFHDISWEDGETFEYLGALFKLAGLGTLKGQGRIPPALGEDLIWAVENIAKYPLHGRNGERRSEETQAMESPETSPGDDWVVVEGE